MTIPYEWLQHLTSVTETPFGSSLARMIVILCVGMLVVAIIGMLIRRRVANSYASDEWWVDDGTRSDNSYYSRDDGTWFGGDTSSWFSGHDTGSGGSDGNWFGND